MTFQIAFAWCLLGSAVAVAQNDSASGPAAPVAIWHFDDSKDIGPRPPTYSAFKPTNTAKVFSGTGIVAKETDFPKVDLRFGQGEGATLEAWVNVEELKDGAYAYIVGKGRTGKPGYAAKNQNYALRLKGDKGVAAISFLFASATTADKPGDWHRWTSTSGFSSAGWHHVAVAYTFGKSDSIRGFIDGKLVPGVWDMGGATDRAPVTDADDITLGTGNGGGASNAFHGTLDEVAIWNVALPEGTLTGRYEFVPPPPVVQRATLTKGVVRVELCEEGLPDRNAWPDQPPRANETYSEPAFAFLEVPHKYVDTGVRGDRGFPLLLRAAAVVKLPAGKHRILLRSRGASRLYFDEKLVLSTPFQTGDGSGHGGIRPPESYLDLGPDFRFAPPGNRESWIPLAVAGGERLVVLETLVGSFVGKSKRRPELGETVVAISPEGSTSWQLLTADERVIPYTDAAFPIFAAERAAAIEVLEAKARAAARTAVAPYWDRRREAAKAWLASTPEILVPSLAEGFPANNPIDHFLAAKIASTQAQFADAQTGTVDYFKQIKPLLEAKCYDCHAGSKGKGGLKLDELASALKGGKSDGPAIHPKKPGESALLARVKSADADSAMPPKGDRLTAEQIKLLETWIREGAAWPEFKSERTTPTPLTDDLAFLRRVTLDVVGVVPTPEEVRTFLADSSPNKRQTAIDRLLADPRWADPWVGYWQDALAENPNILNPTLNNTGPFRWWIYESFRDNKPADLMITELIRMNGSARFGGPAGFAVASQNDAPMATKAMIVASAFLGVEMKCARCHDAPNHQSTQENLFQLAALLGTKPLSVPTTSTVPLDKLHTGGRVPLIKVTLKPGTSVQPRWPFGQFVSEASAKPLAAHPEDPRDRLAALVTAPQNERFAQVLANRVWRRLMGRGIVEPVDDWERGQPTHPELLKWLARELVRSGYDLKHLTRLILNSHAYQRATDPSMTEPGVLYASPAPRKLTAEQFVDSLFVATGAPFDVEEVSLDIDGSRDLNNSISLGQPRRSWMLASTSNERDRPSLALPRIQAVTDVLAAFGWRGSRQEPTSYRESAPSVLQPAVLAHGTMGVWLTRLSDKHGTTALALENRTLEAFTDELYLKLLTRKPTATERTAAIEYLQTGFDTRVRTAPPPSTAKRTPEPYVSWSNHLDPQATVLRQKQEVAARAGDPPTARLDPAWRVRLEDVLWSLINSPEFAFVP